LYSGGSSSFTQSGGGGGSGAQVIKANSVSTGPSPGISLTIVVGDGGTGGVPSGGAGAKGRIDVAWS
jgi:hypothetical protein